MVVEGKTGNERIGWRCSFFGLYTNYLPSYSASCLYSSASSSSSHFQKWSSSFSSSSSVSSFFYSISPLNASIEITAAAAALFEYCIPAGLSRKNHAGTDELILTF